MKSNLNNVKIALGLGCNEKQYQKREYYWIIPLVCVVKDSNSGIKTINEQSLMTIFQTSRGSYGRLIINHNNVKTSVTIFFGVSFDLMYMFENQDAVGIGINLNKCSKKFKNYKAFDNSTVDKFNGPTLYLDASINASDKGPSNYDIIPVDNWIY